MLKQPIQLQSIEHLLDIVDNCDVTFGKLLIIDFNTLGLWNDISFLALASDRLTLINSDVIHPTPKTIIQSEAKEYDFVMYPKYDLRNSITLMLHPISQPARETLQFIADNRDFV